MHYIHRNLRNHEGNNDTSVEVPDIAPGPSFSTEKMFLILQKRLKKNLEKRKKKLRV